MNYTEDDPAPEQYSVPETGASAVPVHQNPTVGGSYTRNLATGALVKHEPASVASEQE